MPMGILILSTSYGCTAGAGAQLSSDSLSHGANDSLVCVGGTYDNKHQSRASSRRIT